MRKPKSSSIFSKKKLCEVVEETIRESQFTCFFHVPEVFFSSSEKLSFEKENMIF